MSAAASLGNGAWTASADAPAGPASVAPASVVENLEQPNRRGMGTIRFIHTSDLQLGARPYYFPDEAYARYAQARIDAISRINGLAADHEAAFVVAAGDVFESNQVEPRTVSRACTAWSASPVPWILLPGNHDHMDAASVFTSATFTSQRPDCVQVLADSTPVSIPGVPGVEVVGAPWSSKQMLHDSVAWVVKDLAPMQGGVRVFLAHGPTDLTAPQASGKTEMIHVRAAEAALAERRFDYLALGDRHSLTRVGNSGAVWYSGSPVSTDFRDPDPNHALLVALASGEPLQVKPLSVGDWVFLEEARELQSDEDVLRLGDWLDSLDDAPRRIVRLRLRGELHISARARLDTVLARAAQRLAVLDLADQPGALVVLPGNLEQQELGLSGYARATWEELAEAARAGDAEAQDALSLAFRLAGQGG